MRNKMWDAAFVIAVISVVLISIPLALEAVAL